MKGLMTKLFVSLVFLGLTSSSAFAVTLNLAPVNKAISIPSLDKKIQQLKESKARTVCISTLGDFTPDQDCLAAIDACAVKYLGVCGDKAPYQTCNEINYDPTFAMTLNLLEDACQLNTVINFSNEGTE